MEMDKRQVCQDLLAILAQLKNGLARIAEAHELTAIQMFAMYSIFEGASTMGQIADTLHCDASNVTGIIDRLVARQLVIRQDAPQDRRTKLVALTVPGAKLINNAMEALPAYIGCKNIGNQESEMLHQIASKLTQ